MGDLQQYYQDSPEVGNSKVIKEKDELEELWNLAETDSKGIKVENDEIGNGRKKETIYFDRLEGLEYDCKSGETNLNSTNGPKLNEEEIVSTSKPEKGCYELLDAYYNLNKTVEEPFDDTVFGFNEEQENKLEVLLKEVSTKCDALVQKLTPKKKEPIEEPGGKINIRNNKDERVKVGMELDPSEEKKEEKAETIPTKHNLDNKAQT
ncbi:25713_t:CDS:2 [Gigaspora margarita]|uniref:25713_t:CDS:1 n=1 Tax=Gigaspora margarita TaxID=4874 RepID=A0ABN7UZM2_GIGMA|nr:25713_t:CDS:2 [Gigaspora margarita]